MADAALEPTETAVEGKQTDRASARRTWLIRLGIAVLLAGLLWGAWYLLFGRNHVSTDNAYVNAEMAQVTPLVSAQVVEVLVSDTQTVRKGDILARLDPTNAQIAVAQAEADLAEARRRFRQTAATSESLSAQVAARGADIVQARAQLATAQAEYEKARVDLQRREALVGDGAVSGDEVTAARQAFASARAALEQARAGVNTAQATRNAASGQYQANEALVRGATVETDPAVLAAKARLESARLDVARSIIRAPIGGVISRRQVQVGQRVAQGSPIMTIIPLDRLYVDANFKERQLRDVKIGMPAKVTSDLYGGDVVYHGRVVGFSGGTGSSMSLIPAQNATGNWIKVVQRLPLRIALDPKELAAHPLRVGLSMEVELDLSDR
ncbi:MAG: EmrA/EmrK family multidrug efflux transporter periplasmic adaptor subunit [Sphingobium sp.]|uniref:EmrA/EmrK family multidrug efflux transporter periplasmic adaptor subunit n=1 Tax=Sphingobium sp. TaxID=1912891 RepID=UPI002E1E1093